MIGSLVVVRENSLSFSAGIVHILVGRCQDFSRRALDEKKMGILYRI